MKRIVIKNLQRTYSVSNLKHQNYWLFRNEKKMKRQTEKRIILVIFAFKWLDFSIWIPIVKKIVSYLEFVTSQLILEATKQDRTAFSNAFTSNN